jgi:muconolactone delta-isomerase
LDLNWLLAAVPAFLAVLLLVLAKQRAERGAWRDWGLIAGDDQRAIVEWLRVHTAAHWQALDGALRVARDDHEQGHDEDARGVLREVDAHAGRHVRLGLARLDRWEDLARPLAALRPLPPLSTRDLRLPSLRRLARLQRLASVVVTDTARFLLGLRVQRAALHLIGWAFAAALLRAQRPDGLPVAIHRMETGRDDLAVLDAQALVTLEALLASLPAAENSLGSRPDST